MVNTLKPGAGFNVDPKSLDVANVRQSQSFAQKAHSLNPTEFLLNVIPSSFFNAFASGDILQVLLVAILSGFAISAMGARGTPILHAIATVIVSRWEKELSQEELNKNLSQRKSIADFAVEPAAASGGGQ